MLDILVISIGLVLVIEGILYFMLASRLNIITEALKKTNPQTIKNFSLVMVIIGVCLIYFTFRFYGEIK
tara:strand:+ start:4569 stop:4775 length:207 start_codon:yes stop_codon:yes gene_type:complete